MCFPVFFHLSSLDGSPESHVDPLEAFLQEKNTSHQDAMVETLGTVGFMIQDIFSMSN